MNRRNFIEIGLGVAAATVLPVSLSAVDFRKTKEKAWLEKDVSKAIEGLYGSSSTTQGKVKLKAPDIAENGAIVPITISSDLSATTVSLYQDSNPEAAVAVWTVPAGGVVDYSLRIKMQKTGTVTAVVESDGKLYTDKKLVKVTKGGCGG
ncbi:MAG: thiosulfate oxidation carrier protein SoxY [Epsilonproteobacteria bacterium]|nr:MAG: thiosulfate oxidation carrier protein SoxY [Campylobacterota bacterium]